jgi:2-C-methyl-D-erythritol 4-phosphate cytidylyltransferase
LKQFAVILAAAGKSSRFSDPFQKKVYTSLANKPLWMYAAEFFSKRQDVGQIVMVISAEDKQLFNEKFAGNAAMLGVQAVIGGVERADSVRNGLEAVNDSLAMVAVHDAARPCLSNQWIDTLFSTALKTKAAVLAIPCSSTIKRVDEQLHISGTVDRRGLWLAQTPQVFDKELLQQAYRKHSNPSSATDEASIVESMGHPVSIVEGSPLNIKVTTRADLKFAELALKALPKSNPFPFG